MNDILASIKKMLGIESEYNYFDQEIIMSINTAIMSLSQLGIGPTTGFVVTNDETWFDFIGDNNKLEAIKSYIYLKVRLLFDPPTSSFVLESINKQILELEWRLLVQVE